jgi:hypothetical protein
MPPDVNWTRVRLVVETFLICSKLAIETECIVVLSAFKVTTSRLRGPNDDNVVAMSWNVRVRSDLGQVLFPNPIMCSWMKKCF